MRADQTITAQCPGCGKLRTLRKYDVGRHCGTCARKEVRYRTQTRNRRSKYKLVTKTINGQEIKVKVYPTGIPCDYIPEALKELRDASI